MEDLDGAQVFCREQDRTIFRTYSCYAGMSAGRSEVNCQAPPTPHSHSIVAGGLPEMS